jgi:hypothetical protein
MLMGEGVCLSWVLPKRLPANIRDAVYAGSLPPTPAASEYSGYLISGIFAGGKIISPVISIIPPALT